MATSNVNTGVINFVAVKLGERTLRILTKKHDNLLLKDLKEDPTCTLPKVC